MENISVTEDAPFGGPRSDELTRPEPATQQPSEGRITENLIISQSQPTIVNLADVIARPAVPSEALNDISHNHRPDLNKLNTEINEAVSSVGQFDPAQVPLTDGEKYNTEDYSKVACENQQGPEVDCEEEREARQSARGEDQCEVGGV